MNEGQMKKLAAIIGLIVSILTIGGIVSTWLLGSYRMGGTVQAMATRAELVKVQTELAASIKATDQALQEHRRVAAEQNARVVARLETQGMLLQEVRNDLRVIRHSGD